MSNTSLLGSYADVSGSGLMFRNRIINGGMDIWQRGTSQTSTGYGSDDRWVNEHSGSTKTHSRQTFTLGQTDIPGNPQYFSRTVVSSVAGTGNYVQKYQLIESVSTFAGETCTLSFWAKADSAKNIAVEFVQRFGTGGGGSAEVNSLGVTTCALTTTWKKFTISVAVPSISGKTLGANNDDAFRVVFWLDAGSSFNARTNSLGQQSGTFDIAQVQMEAGSVATPFERRPIGVELSLCQRYYEKSYDLNTAPGTATGSSACARSGFLTPFHMYQGGFIFKQEKRIAPNITIFSINNGASGSVSEYDSSEIFIANRAIYTSNGYPKTSTSMFSLLVNGTGQISNLAFFHWTASAEL